MSPSLITHVSDQSICATLMPPKDAGFCSLSKGNTPCIGLWVEPEYEVFTKDIIAAACSVAKSYFSPSQKIYVDADASEGLWDSMGFKDNPLYDFTEDQQEMEGAGYEKYILFSDLCAKVGV